MQATEPSAPSDAAETASGPLAGLRVLDLTINVLGPVCTQILGDMGADVIKIEAPGGDQNRWNGPARNPGMSVFFLLMNRNKRSVTLDLKTPEGLEALMRLVESADVLVHSMRAGAAERLGIGYAAVRARNPRIVYGCAPGFRGDGPRWNTPAFDDIIQGASGLAHLNRDANGEPRYFPTVVADKHCGYVLASSIAMALLHRERTGEGQRVEVPMYETMLQFCLFEHLWGGALGGTGDALGYSRMFSPHRKPYPTQDGHLCVLAVNDLQWDKLLRAVDLPQLSTDPRFKDMSTRMRNIDALYAMLGAQLKQRTTTEWMRIFDEMDVTYGPVHSLDDLLEDDYLRKTGFFRRYQHPTEGEVVSTSIPVTFSASPGSYRRPPPRIGEHTEEVLREIGYAEPDAARLAGATGRNPGGSQHE